MTDLPVFNDETMNCLRRMVDEVFTSDRFHKSHKRYLKKVVDDRGEDKIVGSFYGEGTKAALMVTMMMAVIADKNPLEAVLLPDASRTAPEVTTSTDPLPDEFTAKELEARGEPAKPDFNDLKKRYGKPPAELAKPAPKMQEFINPLTTPLDDPGIQKAIKEVKSIRDKPGLNDDIGAQEDELERQLKKAGKPGRKK